MAVQWNCGGSSDVQQLWARFSDFEVVNVRTKTALPLKYYQPMGTGEEHKPCEPGKLTKQGFLQHLRLGNHLRRAYAEPLALSNTNYDQWLYVRSTNYPRTLQSAVGLLLGLLRPPSASAVRILVNDQDHKEIMHGVGLSASSKASEQNPGQPEEEHHGSCPKAVQTLKQQLAGFKIRNPLRQELVTLFGPNISHRTITDIADQVHSRICHSLSLPCTNEGGCMQASMALSVAAEANRMYCEKYQGAHGGKTASVLSMHPFLSEIFKVLQSNADGSSRVRLAVYVGHDTVIAPILAALGYPVCGWPPYASRITFELWQKDKHLRPSHIRILFNGRPITASIAGCSEELCPMKVVLSHVNHALHPSGSFAESCKEA